ncbi:HK97 family phage prohead protease [Mycobacterium sp. PS03-16]|uniref:HK97 family phage prohead protease n=1 Tax=Mycobacterium sp. PS03-16 TaxID=2559611 RepID=UPI00143151F1|nr:HK97 family phage prohead protease [Mycobacterium sp. PS03-16]
MNETRFGVELRAEVSGNKLVGHAAVFGQFATLPGHLEALSRSAFDAVRTDAKTDVRALYEHDPSKLLGRQASGTLRWSVDSEGLPFEVDLPDTTHGRDVRELAARGDLTGASFGFVPGADEWGHVEGQQVRTHTSVARLVDLSVVAFPAYTGATVMLRSLDRVKATVATPESARSQLIRTRHRILLT